MRRAMCENRNKSETLLGMDEREIKKKRVENIFHRIAMMHVAFQTFIKNSMNVTF